jgi:hypothetical protein
MAPHTLVVSSLGICPGWGSSTRCGAPTFCLLRRRAVRQARLAEPESGQGARRSPHWLTVPILHSGRNWPSILEVEIDNRTPWARKHIGTLRQFYRRAPFLDRHLPALEEIHDRRWTLLVDLDLAVTHLLCGWLGIERRTLRASELGIPGKQSERLLALCQHVGARRYLSGDSARNYLDTELFARHGVEIEWQNYVHPTYPQQYGDFIPYLSVVDLLFNCGEDSLAILGHTGGGK